MADTDLPVAGRDVTMHLLVDGVLKRVFDQIVEFEENAVYDRIETKVLGTSDVQIDDTIIGWEGSSVFAVSRATLDEMMDEVHAAQRARIPVQINFRATTRYRDGSSKSYVYPDCKVQVSTRTTRAESKRSTLNWKTGKNRRVV